MQQRKPPFLCFCGGRAGSHCFLVSSPPLPHPPMLHGPRSSSVTLAPLRTSPPEAFTGPPGAPARALSIFGWPLFCCRSGYALRSGRRTTAAPSALCLPSRAAPLPPPSPPLIKTAARMQGEDEEASPRPWGMGSRGNPAPRVGGEALPAIHPPPDRAMHERGTFLAPARRGHVVA